jgi:Putative Actinobacterial Holin-X, holin superfamily III
VNDSPPPAEATLAQLFGGFVSDARELLRQEVARAKREVHAELHKTMRAMVSLSLGLGLAALGGMVLIVMLVHLVNTVTELLLWSCYGMVGGVCILSGGMLLYLGKHTITHIDMLPQQTVETMKENVKWIKEKMIPDKR